MEQTSLPVIKSRQLDPPASARLKQFKAYAVLHPHLAQVDQHLSRAIEEPAGFACVLLYGPTGVGKTTVLQQIQRRYQEMAVSSTPSLLSSLAHRGQSPSMPLLVLETRPPDGPTFDRADYYRAALKQLGEYTYEQRTIVDIDAETSLRAEKGRVSGGRGKAALFNDSPVLRRALEETLVRRGVQAVLLDEAQHLLKISSGVRLIDQLDWLKSMSNVSGVLHVLIGTYELLALRHLNGQAARRSLEIHFPRYQFQSETDQRTFQGVLLTLLGQVPLAVDREALLQAWPYFYERSIGCVGVLMDWLVRAVSATLADGQSELTLARLQQYALPEAQCESMAMEATAGEQELHYTASRRERLWTLLGMRDATQKGADGVVPAGISAEAAQGAEAAAPVRKKPPHQGGERAPSRDPVGLTEKTVGKPAPCSFSGEVVNLSPAQLAQAALPKLQCPECGAIWKACIRANTVSFPRHPRRTNKRGQAVPCWIRQGATWTPSGESV